MDSNEAALISSSAQLAGQGINAYATAKMNKKDRQFSKEMYEKQRADNIDFWNMQNAYNDPAAQMQRMKNSGLNPHLIYGNGTDAQAGPISTPSAPQWNPKTPQVDLGSVASAGIQAYLNMEQQKANIAATNAQTQYTLSQTEDRQFRNTLNTPEYQAAMKYNREHTPRLNTEKSFYDTASAKYNSQDKELDLETKSKLTKGGFYVEKFKTELENLKKLGDIRGLETKLKQMEVDLSKLGIHKGDELWQRIVGKILQKFTDISF
jgi:hypothetical protein